MSPEERELLEKSVALAEDNNKILHSLRRSLWMQRLMSILYWIIVLGISVGAYYYVEPYLDKAMRLYDSLSATQEKVNKAAGSVNEMLEVPDSILKSFFK